MKKSSLIKLIFAAAMACFAVSSCWKGEEYITYDYYTFVNVPSSNAMTCTTDAGEKFNVTDLVKGCQSLRPGERAYIVCDVMSQNTDKSYNVKLKEVDYAKVAKITNSENIEDFSKVPDDPVYVQSAWISGGYLNLIVINEFLEASLEKHTFDLYWNKNYNTPETVMFKLRHDGKGEAGPKSPYYNYLSQEYSFLSFPLKGFEPESDKTIQLEYNWYSSDGSGNIEPTIISSKYSPSKYVQEEAK